MSFPDIIYLDKLGEVVEMDNSDIKEQIPENLWGEYSGKINGNTLTPEDKLKLEGYLSMFLEPWYEQTVLCIWRFTESKESIFGNTFLGCTNKNEKFTKHKCRWGDYTIYLEEMIDGERYYGWSQETRDRARDFYKKEKERCGLL